MQWHRLHLSQPSLLQSLIAIIVGAIVAAIIYGLLKPKLTQDEIQSSEDHVVLELKSLGLMQWHRLHLSQPSLMG
jgi:MFS-type transporter involved in bile tolerance (Atg22 family)